MNTHSNNTAEEEKNSEVVEEDTEYELIEDEEGTTPRVRNQVQRLRERLKKCQQEKQEYLEGWQRAKADLINARNDADRRIADAHDRAGERVLEDILGVVDHFETALMSMPVSAKASADRSAGQPEENGIWKAWGEGVQQIVRQLQGVLTAHGVETVAVVEGDAFDPSVHEAIEHRDGDEDEVIVEVRRKGYRLRDRVLRPAQVIVSKKSEE